LSNHSVTENTEVKISTKVQALLLLPVVTDASNINTDEARQLPLQVTVIADNSLILTRQNTYC